METSILILMVTLSLIPVDDFTWLSQTASDKRAKKIIAYTKNLEVSEIDPHLPKQKLANWLSETLGPGAIIKWEVNDCGEQTGTSADRDRDLPFCAGIDAKLPDGRSVEIAVAVGTEKKGLTRQSGTYVIYITDGGQVHSIGGLHQLPAALKNGKN